MLLYWKFLLVLGIVLWVSLCLSDYIYSKDSNYNAYICESAPFEPEIDKEELNWLIAILSQYIDMQAYNSFCEDNNIPFICQCVFLTLLCTIIFYSIGKVFPNLIVKYQSRERVFANATVITLEPIETEIVPVPILESSKEAALTCELVQKSSHANLVKSNSVSKIPVLVTRHEAQSPINTQESASIPTGSATVQFGDETNKSCPNLSPKSSVMKSKILFSLYDNKVNNIKSSKSVDRLRDEIVLLQATSFKQQEILSRKLDAIVKEKHDLSNALANSLRENKSAKRKLEDIQKERTILIRQLESATNEIKSNTKSKKLTLTRLEKAIEESKGMKDEFTRLNEEKNKLEEKVMILDRECKEMKARRSVLNKSYSEIKQNYDGDSAIYDKTDDDSLTSGGYYEVTDKQLHQSNIDMNKVQTKLNDLEKSLEKLKFSSTITKERERSLQEESNDNILTVGMQISNYGDFGTNSRSKFSEDDEEDSSMDSQNPNYNHGDATAITSASSLEIDDCQSLCLVPGCSREHNICENPVCVYDHTTTIQDESITRKRHYSPEKGLDANRVTSTNQIILEAVKEKSTVLANRSSLFDTREARARLAAFFSVTLWKKRDNPSCSADAVNSEDRLSIESQSEKTEFEYHEWSPRLIPPGIVSQSPAFQKFLSNIIVDQRNAMMEQNMLRTG